MLMFLENRNLVINYFLKYIKNGNTKKLFLRFPFKFFNQIPPFMFVLNLKFLTICFWLFKVEILVIFFRKDYLDLFFDINNILSNWVLIQTYMAGKKIKK